MPIRCLLPLLCAATATTLTQFSVCLCQEEIRRESGKQTSGKVEAAAKPNDARLKPLKDLNGYFPFEVPENKEAWTERATALRRQVLIATGLWPTLPDRTPMNAVIHGKVQRDGFTVEKVYFESVPNHFVTGLLFRPDDGKSGIKRPAVLCPHGHGGRMQDYGADKMAELIESGAEKFERSGRFPKIARCAHLARMGCFVFIFDMLGYEDSQQISYELAHRFKEQRPDFEGKTSWGLFSAQAEMRLQSIMGLQTWNSIRCLDFLEQLPDVDPSRIGVTGGSGGGTQTILLCAIDDRPIVAFPNGMVSTAMQGGCTCENCTLLRVGTGNVELAALFAPKPQAMTAADDWTKDMMTKGYPELQELYGMLGEKEQVFCRPLLHFPHNYNFVSRETMYSWFNEHLALGLSDFEEQDFKPLTKQEVSVWNDEHPSPAGGDAYERALTKYLAEESDKQLKELEPTNEKSLAKYQSLVGGAFRAIIGRGLPATEKVSREKLKKLERDGYWYFEDKLRLDEAGEELPIISFYPKDTDWSGDVVIWVDGEGKNALFDSGGEINADVKKLVDAGAAVLSADLFQQGEFLDAGKPLKQQRSVENPREAAAYSFCYNHTLFSHRVHDVLTLISFASNDAHDAKRVSLIGTNGAGPIAAMARMIAGKKIYKALIHTDGFRFEDINSYLDPNFLPGAVKYGDLPAILALNAPHHIQLVGEERIPALTAQSYLAAQSPKNVSIASDFDIFWLLKK